MTRGEYFRPALIAAAPDLLAALLDAQEFITASDHSGNEWQKAVMETMSDAIDKAFGETP